MKTKAKSNREIARLKQQARILAKRLRGDFPEVWYNGQHWTSEEQRRECRQKLAHVENRLHALSTGVCPIGSGGPQ
jgi:hypothetical protein